MLVPAEQDSYMRQMLPPTVPHLANLDNEMNKILNSNNEAADVKLKRYNQVLRRYMQLQGTGMDNEDTSTPKHPDIENSISEQTSAAAAPDILPYADSSILAGIPSRNLNAARRLLQYMKRNDRLRWNEKGEMIVNGERYPLTNIVDLVHDFSRFRKTMNPPAGYLTFAQALKAQNIPRESVGNPDRWKLLQDIGNASVPFEQATLGPATSTPIRFSRSPSMRTNRNTSSSNTSNITWYETGATSHR